MPQPLPFEAPSLSSLSFRSPPRHPRARQAARASMRIYADASVPFVPSVGVFDLLLPACAGISTLPAFAACLPALSGDGERLDRGELRQRALSVASGLRARGVRRGDAVCVLGPPSGRWALGVLGVLAAGGVVVPVPCARALEDAMRHTRASLVIAPTAGQCPKDVPSIAVSELLDAAEAVAETGGNNEGSDAQGEAAHFPGHLTHMPAVTSNGVVTSQHALCAALLSCAPELGPGDSVCPTLPACDARGILALLLPLALGAELCFDDARVTAILGPIPASEASKASSGSQPVRQSRHFPSLRTVLTSPGHHRHTPSGAQLSPAFGLPEAPAVFLSDAAGALRLVPGLQARIVGHARQGETRGELLLRGPSVSPTAPDDAGWLHTDVVVSEAQEAWTILGRRGDAVRVRGTSVWPADIEGLLALHPDVLDAAVVGVRRAEREGGEGGGEELWAFVVFRAHARPQHLMRWVQARKQKRKWVTAVVVLDEVPRDGFGDVRRVELRRRAAEGADVVHYFDPAKLAKL